MNAFEIPGDVRFTLIAASECDWHRFVKVDSNGKAAYATAAGDPIVGVSYTKAAAGQPLSIINDGIVFVEASAAISAGALVSPTTAGKAVTDANNGKYVAITSAAAAGDVISVLL